jgi:hypothetical protein
MKRIFNFYVLFVVMVGAVITLSQVEILASDQQGKLIISYPQNETLFPRDMFAPTFRWNDKSSAELWRVTINFADNNAPITDQVEKSEWRPSKKQWETIKIRSLEKNLTVTVQGIKKGAPRKILSEGRVTIRTSKDPVGAPIFYRDVPLPVMHALKNKQDIRYLLGNVSMGQSPRVVLKGIKTCANCHSFSANGKFLAMDVDRGNDKGSYAITKINKTTTIDMGDMITWNDYDRKNAHKTFGLLSQISPDGRYVISTVKEETLVGLYPDLYYPQMFFPIKGILVVYDTVKRGFFSLPGGDHPGYVQTNPAWSPDGKSIVFCRAREFKIGDFNSKKEYIAARKKAKKTFEEGGAMLRYDLYRIPFNNGKGGEAEPLPGASKNGRSNYFAKFSPDGKWIVFCQADKFMLNQPDSLLHIIPAQGGTPRQMRCNTPGRMNSWHSWSPNGKWLVFSSKAVSPYTKLYITHVDEQGNDTPPVLLEGFVDSNRAANIPEFVNIHSDGLLEIQISKEIAGSQN